jgi:hypothetical protein
MNGKVLLVALTLVQTALCVCAHADEASKRFSDQAALAKMNDRDFKAGWESLSADDRIDILRKSNADKNHPLRQKRSALRSIILITPMYVAGSETATIHNIYINELAKLADDIWQLKIDTKNKTGNRRFKEIQQKLAEHPD